MLMNYTGTFSPEEIYSAHVQFSEIFEKPLVPGPVPVIRKRSARDRVRIGYISPDFRSHSVARFIEPVFMSHSEEDFEVFCYSNVDVPDHVTGRIRSLVVHWREIRGLSDDEAIALIQKDEIDILVDFAGHTSGNRMLLFAKKPAPVQASWIGYPATTGLSSMDYKIVDSYTDPPGITERYYTEQLIRLPGCFLCCLPASDSPETGPQPALTQGHVTFGSFNNFAKVSRDSVEMWAEILKGVPDSRLILKSHCFQDAGTRKNALEMFAGRGIAQNRVKLFPYMQSSKEHLSLYNSIDIALDTFPYNGTTTTCEALWMGVPVITLAGNCHASRVGISLLSNTGLGEFIAQTKEEYVDIAVKTAKDTKRLKDLRVHLRGIVAASPLTDAGKFTKNLEDAYRMMRARGGHTP
jgi:protein O-GlcNAc transferase